MEYTEEQARKAIMDKLIDDANKLRALDNHKMAMAWVDDLGLPYRLSLDYLKRNKDIKEIPIQRWYPYPCVPLVASLSLEERTPKRLKELQGKYNNLTPIQSDHLDYVPCIAFKYIDDEQLHDEQRKIETRAREKARPYLPWVVGDDKWCMYFAWMIAKYEDAIPTWGSFDLWGNNEHNAKDVQKYRDYLLGVIKGYKMHPSGYDKSIRLKSVDDYTKYDLLVGGYDRGYMWVDDCIKDANDNMPNYDNNLDVMINERELEKRNLIERHHLDVYANTDIRYESDYLLDENMTRLHRINEVISILTIDN